MKETLPIESLLDSVAISLDRHGVNIDTSRLGNQFHSDGSPIYLDTVAASLQPAEQGIDLERVDEHIDIVVGAGLPTDERIHRPTTIDLVDHVVMPQPIHDFDDFRGWGFQFRLHLVTAHVRNWKNGLS